MSDRLRPDAVRTRERPAALVVVCPAEPATGFRLAGVETIEVETADAAAEALDRLLDEGVRGVVAVYEPLWLGLDEAHRRRLAASLDPITVVLPTGAVGAGELRRARLAELVREAVGVHLVFRGEEGP